MGFRFQRPFALVLLLTVLWAALLWRKNEWHFSLIKNRAIGFVRCVVLASLVLAIAGLEILWPVDTQSVAFVVDASRSVQRASSVIKRWVSDSLGLKDADNEASVVVFGKEAAVDAAGADLTFWGGHRTVVDADRSNLEAALRLAAATLPSDKCRRIVLISDGNQNMGDVLKEARMLASEGIRLDVVPVLVEAGDEVLIDRIHAPTSVPAGSVFSLGVRLKSNCAGEGVLRVYQADTRVHESEVSWTSGDTNISVRLGAERPGLHGFKVTLETLTDTLASNNEASAVVNVVGVPTALIITADLPGARNISDALSAANVSVLSSLPAHAPITPAEWAKHSMVVLFEVASDDLPERSQEALELAVRELGCGLVMVGGEDSFGPGGYFNTPIERALPVYMDIKSEGEIANLGLVLVIDKSGSMSETTAGISKMGLAREAALRSAEFLGPNDVLGVVAFDSSAKWVVEPRKASDQDLIQDLIMSIQAGGGTNIYPGLELAHEALESLDTRFRHVILLSDGMSQGGDYQGLIRKMLDADITLSTVAVGLDADRLLLEQLAVLGTGRHYFTADSASIPKIFAKETVLALRDYIKEGRFSPALRWASPLLQGIHRIPDLTGCVMTTPKENALVVLETPDGEPVLAKWQYGLGRAVAWTSDCRGRWIEDWLGGDQFATLWQNIAAYLVKPEDVPGYEMSVAQNHENTEIFVETPLEAPALELSIGVVAPDSQVLYPNVEQLAPGRYSASFDTPLQGPYLVQATLEGDDGSDVTLKTGVAVPYSPEYRLFGTDTALLEEAARITGGEIIDDPAFSWANNLQRAHSKTVLTRLFLLIACLLLPVEVGLRKIRFGKDQVRRVLAKTRRPKPQGVSDPTISRLLRAQGEKRQIPANKGVRPLTQMPVQSAEPEHRTSQQKAEKPQAIDSARLLSHKRRREDAHK